MKKTQYKVHTNTNFSIGEEEFYLIEGSEVALPDHELIDSMVLHGHLTKVEQKSSESKKTNDKK